MQITARLEALGLRATEGGFVFEVPHSSDIPFRVEGERVFADLTEMGTTPFPIPLPATEDHVARFIETWAKPACARSKPFEGGVILQAVNARLRAGPPRVQLGHPDAARVRIFLGEGDADVMASIENALTMFTWAVNPPLKQATGDGGLVSQHRMLLTGALLSVERHPFGPVIGYVLDVQYVPVPGLVDWPWYEAHLGPIVEGLPEGFPPDVLAFLPTFGLRRPEAAVVATFAAEPNFSNLTPLIATATPGTYGDHVGDWIASAPLDRARHIALFGAARRGDAPEVVAAALQRPDLDEPTRVMLLGG